MNLVAAKLLWDVRQACRRARGFLAARSAEEFRTDALLRSAVERQLITVGEALAALRRAAPEIASRIEDTANAIGLRNLLVHRYSDIEPDILLEKAVPRLPFLEDRVDALLREIDPDAPT